MGPYLEQICEDGHIEAEPGVLRLAMRAGGGSVRDTLSVLDQLMVGAVDGSIVYDSAVALLGFTPDALIGEAVDAVADKNGEALYGVIQKVVVGGFDPRRFVEDLLARVRDLLVLTLGGERAESVLSDDAAAENMDDLRRQASALGLSALTQMADTINATLANMTGAISPRMRLELLAARLLAGREEGMAVVASSSGVPDFCRRCRNFRGCRIVAWIHGRLPSPCGTTCRRKCAGAGFCACDRYPFRACAAVRGADESCRCRRIRRGFRAC